MHGKVGCKKKTISANASTCKDRYAPSSGTSYLLPENDVTCPFLIQNWSGRVKSVTNNVLKTLRKEIAMHANSRSTESTR